MLPLFIATNIYLKINIVYCTFFILFFFLCVFSTFWSWKVLYTNKVIIKVVTIYSQFYVSATVWNQLQISRIENASHMCKMLEIFGFCKPINKKSSEITTSVCLSTAADLWRLNTSGNSPKKKQLWHLVGISSKHSTAEKMSRSCELPRTTCQIWACKII